MKTHLPVALRKTLLAALVAVSALAYNRAHAFDITVAGTRNNNGLIFNGFGIVVKPDEGGPALADGNTVTSIGGSVTLKGDVGGDNNAVTADGDGNVTVEGDVEGDNNTLTVKGDGDLTVTGAISGNSNTLTLEGDGNVSTGAISGDSNKLVLQGEGTLSFGTISGEDTVIEAEKMVVEDLNDISNAKLTVKSINETDDVQATLTNSTVEVKEGVLIGNTTDQTGELSLFVTKLTVGKSVDIRQDVCMAGSEISGETISVTDGEASLSGSTVTARTGAVTIDGGTTAANTIEGAGTHTLVAAATSVDIKGATNTIQAGAAVTAGDGSVTIDAATSNIVQSGAAVTAESGIDITAGGTATNNGNLISGSTLTANTGDINVTAANGNEIASGAEVEATAGSVTITGTTVNEVAGAGTVVTAGAGSVTIKGGDSAVNVVDAAKVDARGINGIVDMSGASNLVRNEAEVLGAVGITIASNSTAAENGNWISASTVQTAAGDVVITAEGANRVTAGAEITATTGSVDIDGYSNTIDSASNVTAGGDVSITGEESNTIDASTVTAVAGAVTMGNAAGSTDDVVNSIRGESTVEAGDDVSLTGDKNAILAGSTVEAGDDVSLTGDKNAILAGSTVEAGEDVTMTGASYNAISESTVDAGDDVSLDAVGYNAIKGASDVTAGGDVSITGEESNTIDASTVTAVAGAVTMGNAAGSTDDVVNSIRGESTVEAGDDVSLTGDKNAILDGSKVTAGGDVSMRGEESNTIEDSTVTAKDDVSLDAVGDNVINGVSVVFATGEVSLTAGGINIIRNGSTVTAGGDVNITGENVITSTDLGSTSITAQNGDIIINDDNYIKNAVIEAQGAEGDVSITTGTGDKNTWIEDTSITGETVTIAGDISDDRSAANLAVVTGAEMKITSRGEDNGVGITLNNVSVLGIVKGATSIIAEGDGNIVLLNRVDMENGTLTIEDGTTSDARIVLDAGNVLNTKETSRLEGRLTGEGDINKSGGDGLLLDYDHTEFNGTIYVNGAVVGAEGSVVDASNAGSWIEITSANVGTDRKAGVGEEATIVLKSTDLVINTTEAQIGTLDTTQDEAGMNNVHATGGTLVSLGGDSDGSYTMDDNTRVDFTTVGSVLEVNMGTSGDVVHATNMTLSDATLLKLDATVDGAGQASSDIIAATGTINVAARAGLNSIGTAAAPSTARVYINHTDMAAAAKAAEGARTTIMSGAMVTNINEDVLYDVARSANGTYQRELLDRNVHLENKGDQVDLVYSKNYRTCARTQQMNYVAGALRQISDTFHHAEGVLAASNNRLHNLIDAFDYTRSEGAAQRGLQSVAGTSLVLPRLMMFDSSRRHIEQLRKQITMPDCNSVSNKGVVIGDSRYTNAWVTYTGSYDYLEGDTYMGDYRRKAHGAMAGVDHSLSCNLRLGLSLGYENSDGYADDAHVEAETFFVDVYAAGVTGRFKHRASVGLATSSHDTSRYVMVEAGYHTFRGHGDSGVDAAALNFGYEISTDIELNESSRLTPYAALNFSWHSQDTGIERGMGAAGLYSKCDNEWQSEIVLGVAYSREFTALPNQAPAQFYANAGMHLELFNDRVTVQNRFIGSPYGWRAESMKRKPLYFELGAGVAVPLTPSWTGTAGAAVEAGVDRKGVSGNVGVRYKF